jgi:hypothetical protein
VYILVGDGQVELYSKPEFIEGAVEAVDASLFRVFDADGREARFPATTQKASL